MRHECDDLLTPIHVKTSPDEPWPTHPFFYYVAAQGLFLCRNHRFFVSSVPVEKGPGELADHHMFLRSRYPKVPRDLLEQVVGFFDIVAAAHGAEAAVLLAWDSQDDRVFPIVPEQTCTVIRGAWGRQYALGLEYDPPADLDPHVMIIGDIHSHVDGAAYASWTDKRDETQRAGVHIVVGRISEEPPEFHIDVTADGARFQAAHSLVLEGYECRNLEIDATWVEKVKITYQRSYASATNTSTSESLDLSASDALIEQTREYPTYNVKSKGRYSRAPTNGSRDDGHGGPSGADPGEDRDDTNTTDTKEPKHDDGTQTEA